MIPAVANHLWQSTLFVCAIGLATLMFRRNRAAVRHGLWMAASVKFLIPFSLLVGIGNHLEWRRDSAGLQTRLGEVEQISEPFSLPARATHFAPPNAANWCPAAFLALWLCGFAANSLAWWRRWRSLRAAIRAASPLHLNLSIPVIGSPARLEPGIFGVFHPTLLLPTGLRERLTPTQFAAVLAHELCHVRRHDNLWLAIHMAVEALFWFHPAVWWIEARLVEERERACDEEVIRMGGDPQDYAEGILAVCEYYLGSPLPCVSGVTGSSLKRRVEKIMTNRAGDDMSIGRKVLLVSGGMSAVIGPLLVGMIQSPSIRAQEAATHFEQMITSSSLPEFEVASIKPSAPDARLNVVFAPGGKLSVTNATLRFLIKIAYDIGDDQLAGGSGWISSKRFDLAAVPERNLGGDQQDMTPDQIILFHKPVRLRLQRLLADRFQLQLRKESTPMPVFTLVIAKGGPKKLTVTRSSGKPQLKTGSGVLSAVGVDMDTFAKFLSEGLTGRPVVNMTGLQGKYDFHLEWTPESSLNAADNSVDPAANSGGVSIFGALRQELGLRLEARTDAVDRFVVVGAELPSLN